MPISQQLRGPAGIAGAYGAELSARLTVRHRWRFALAFLLVPVWLGIAHAAVAAQPFPADSGALNVRDFGAKGNGQDDDTAALLAAIAAAGTDTGAFFWRTRIVYLPAGTYLVSRPAGETLRRPAIWLGHDPHRPIGV